MRTPRSEARIDNGAVDESDCSGADDKFGGEPLRVDRSLVSTVRFAQFEVKTGRREPVSSPRV